MSKVKLFNAGHTACSGCGLSLAARLVMEAAGPNVMVTNSTGCLEVFTTRSPQTAWGVPWVHSLFENSSALATGIVAALNVLGRGSEARVIAMGGDGSTADIGFGSISGMWERGDDVLYICFDNEAYMNTGIQRSGLTPFLGSTSTSPAGSASTGNQKAKKNIPMIAVAHGVKYVATASVGYQRDLQNKVKKALAIRGPKYLQVLVPCPLGWGADTALTIQLGRLAVETGLHSIFEVEEGKITSVMTPSKPKPVEEFLKLQVRFKHLMNKPEELKKIQAIADSNLKRYTKDKICF